MLFFYLLLFLYYVVATKGVLNTVVKVENLRGETLDSGWASFDFLTPLL